MKPTAPMGDVFDYDLLVIGSGSAGMSAAIRGSELGATVAIVEGASVVGGTCVNVGCIPSKFLIEAAHRYHIARTPFAGISACEPQIAWNAVQASKREIVESLRTEKYLDVLRGYERVTLLRGRALLLGDGAVRVGETRIRPRKIVIATGAAPASPPIPGLSEVTALDSTTVMEIERLPDSMIVLGGGSIGLELGQAFSRFGVRVIVIEAARQILPSEDADVVEQLAESLQREGMEIHTGATVTRVEQAGRKLRLHFANAGLISFVEADQLLVATGRRPNTDSLGLDAAGVNVTVNGFIEVDEFMQTSNPHIYAAGDVTGGPGFVYVAALAGGIAAQAALSELAQIEPLAIDLNATPSVTFTDPQIASVGLTVAQAEKAGMTTKVSTLPLNYLPRAIVSGRTSGLVKLVADADTDRLLGAHIASANAGDIIGEAALAVKFGLRVQEIVSTLHPYLTWGEAIKLAGQTFTKDVATLSCCA